MNGFEAHLLDEVPLDFSTLLCPNTVFDIVDPELILTHLWVPVFRVVFPVPIRFAIHRCLEIQRFLKPWKAYMLGDHRVLVYTRDKSPMPPGILAVIEEILPDNLGVRVAEDPA